MFPVGGARKARGNGHRTAERPLNCTFSGACRSTPRKKKRVRQVQPVETQAAGALARAEIQTLDPPIGRAFRTQAHRMLDDMLDYTQNIRQRPVWQPIPEEVRERFREALFRSRPPLSPTFTTSS